MDFDSIARFIAVIDNGSFAAAARVLDITPQALSTSIAKLEKSLGVVLFDRERGGITKPTEFGDAFLPHARFMMAAEQRAVEEVHARRDARSGWVRLGIGESMAGAPVARAIARLRETAPDARVAVVDGYTQDMLARLDAGELDLVAGAPDSDRAQARDLVQIPLYVSQDVIVARADHPLASKSNVSLADMQDYTWLLSHTRRDSFQTMIDAYAREGLKAPQNVMFMDSVTVGIELLATEDYLIFISRDIFWPRLGTADAQFVVIDAKRPVIERNACLLYRSDYPLSAMAEQLRDNIIAEIGESVAQSSIPQREVSSTARKRSKVG
ncbi:LysR family transcriptional regulator [Novosphingobium resinovorum]|uniref:LysR family transcriptional regulator n=1 Tax=Novosphingobium resinovorum TaxID=158500 RepID=UPI002ED5D3AB|nr:LysR family transcriptional regulator [Novosphingobium resinovorum]